VVRVENIILEVHSKQGLETHTQDQYIGFNVGSAILLGSAPDNLPRFNTETIEWNNSWSRFYMVIIQLTIDGTRAYGNSYLASSVIAFAAAGNPHC
jgi:hypothetical protein